MLTLPDLSVNSPSGRNVIQETKKSNGKIAGHDKKLWVNHSKKVLDKRLGQELKTFPRRNFSGRRVSPLLDSWDRRGGKGGSSNEGTFI
jgi:hypothetical protein